jgi:hypothetical protein
MVTEVARGTERLAKFRERYRKTLERAVLTDQEINEMRSHMIRLAQTICEHVWGKRFY